MSLPLSVHLSEPVLAPTRRQVEALRAYLGAGSYESAAQRLGISPRTLKLHLAALRLRLGVQTNAQAVHRLWLGYNDHLAECDRDRHVDCAPRLPGAVDHPS